MKRTLVRELMTRRVVTLDQGQSVPTAQELIKLLHIRHLPVVNADGALVGLVTHRSLLATHAQLLEEIGGSDTGRDVEMKIPLARVMETDVHCVKPETAAVEALGLMLDKNVGSLPVVEGGKVVGIITSRDFLTFELKKLQQASEPDRVAPPRIDDPSAPTVPDRPARAAEPTVPDARASLAATSAASFPVREARMLGFALLFMLVLVLAMLAYLISRGPGPACDGVAAGASRSETKVLVPAAQPAPLPASLEPPAASEEPASGKEEDPPRKAARPRPTAPRPAQAAAPRPAKAAGAVEKTKSSADAAKAQPTAKQPEVVVEPAKKPRPFIPEPIPDYLRTAPHAKP